MSVGNSKETLLEATLSDITRVVADDLYDTGRETYSSI